MIDFLARQQPQAAQAAGGCGAGRRRPDGGRQRPHHRRDGRIPPEGGRQDLRTRAWPADRSKSITDACIGWEDNLVVLGTCWPAVRQRQVRKAEPALIQTGNVKRGWGDARMGAVPPFGSRRPPRRLAREHPGVGHLDEIFGARRVFREGGHADAGADRWQAVWRRGARRVEIFAATRLASPASSVSASRIRIHRCPGATVSQARTQVRRRSADLRQGLVAGGVAAQVVDAPEIIQIDKQQPDPLGIAGRGAIARVSRSVSRRRLRQ